MAKATKALPEGRIVVIRKKAEYVGRVHARDAEKAIEIAIKEYEITDPERQKRLAAQPVGS
jgi:hypothetical protein